jgi:hypothetical protein
MVDWSLTCALAMNQTVQSRQETIVAWSAVTVHRVPFRCPHHSLHRFQVTCYCCVAAGSAALGLLWLRLIPGCKASLWHLYGRFCLVVFMGSVIGAVSWSSKMRETLLYIDYEFDVTGSTAEHKYRARAVSNYWSAAHMLLFGSPASIAPPPPPS